MGGINVSGPAYNSGSVNSGCGQRSTGHRIEGATWQPCDGANVRIEGGQTTLNDCWISYGMASPAPWVTRRPTPALFIRPGPPDHPRGSMTALVGWPRQSPTSTPPAGRHGSDLSVASPVASGPVFPGEGKWWQRQRRRHSDRRLTGGAAATTALAPLPQDGKAACTGGRVGGRQCEGCLGRVVR